MASAPLPKPDQPKRAPSYINFTPRRAMASFENLVALANYEEHLKEARKMVWRDRGEPAVEVGDLGECIEHGLRGGLRACRRLLHGLNLNGMQALEQSPSQYAQALTSFSYWSGYAGYLGTLHVFVKKTFWTQLEQRTATGGGPQSSFWRGLVSRRCHAWCVLFHFQDCFTVLSRCHLPSPARQSSKVIDGGRLIGTIYGVA